MVRTRAEAPTWRRWHDTTEEYLEAILEIEEEGIIPIRARLVERLGLSAPAVSETVNRLVDHGYAELLDDRSLRLTDKGRDARDLGRPPAPPRRAPPRRRDRARVGEGPPRGRPLGARHLRRRRGEARAAARRPRHLPARQPDPGPSAQADGPTARALDLSEPGPVRLQRISEKIELDDGAIQFLADAKLIPGLDATIIGREEGGVRVITEAGEQLVPPRLAQLVYVRPM